jgi:hypothetical protein
MQAQHRYKRLMVAAGQRTVPAHEQVFRTLDSDRHLGHDRLAPHYVTEGERIAAAIAEQRRCTHEPGPYSDKLNNMYMRNWNHVAYPFTKVRDLKPWGAPEGVQAAEIRGSPRDPSHYDALTPWRNGDQWTKHQRTACKGTQHRLAAAKARAADLTKEQAARKAKNAEAHKVSTMCHEAEDVPTMRTLAIRDEFSGAVRYPVITSDIRPPWRKAGQGVMKQRKPKKVELDDIPTGHDWQADDAALRHLDGDVLGGED